MPSGQLHHRCVVHLRGGRKHCSLFVVVVEPSVGVCCLCQAVHKGKQHHRTLLRVPVINDSKINDEERNDQTNGDTRFNVENPSNNGGEKTTGASQQYFTISGEVTNAEDLHNATYPNRRLTRGIYNGGAKP